MLEQKCNIWDKYLEGKIVCITTNGFVKKSMESTMGRGVAKQAKKYVPRIAYTLGKMILQNGNVAQPVTRQIISFPVKPKWGVAKIDKMNIVPHMRDRFSMGLNVPGWACMADMEIIERSLWELKLLSELDYPDESIYLPKPGCGACGLKWEDVKPLCERYDDWLIVCDL